MSESQNKIELKIDNARHIDVNPENGLSNSDVQDRIDNGLTNKSPKRVTKSFFKIFVDNFLNFFNILLFTIGAFLLFAHIAFDDFSDIKYYFFLFILTANILIGFFKIFTLENSLIH